MVTGQHLPTPSVTCNFGRYLRSAEAAYREPLEAVSHRTGVERVVWWVMMEPRASGSCRDTSSSLASMLTGPKGPGDWLCAISVLAFPPGDGKSETVQHRKIWWKRTREGSCWGWLWMMRDMDTAETHPKLKEEQRWGSFSCLWN